MQQFDKYGVFTRSSVPEWDPGLETPGCAIVQWRWRKALSKRSRPMALRKQAMLAIERHAGLRGCLSRTSR